MPYIITRYSSATSADPGWPKVINDGTVDTSTGLNLLGRGKTGYGKNIAENFVRLLENFASNTPPNNAVTGQLWYKVSDRDLYVCVSVSSTPVWQKIAKITVSTNPPTANFSEGSFYFQKGTTSNQLWVNNGSNWIRIGGLIISNTTPTSASSGYLWYQTSQKTLRIYVGGSINDWLPLVTTDFNENGKIVAADVSGGPHTLIKFGTSSESNVVITSTDLNISDYSGVHPDVSSRFTAGLKYGLNAYDIKIHNSVYESVQDNIAALGLIPVSAFKITKTNNFVTNATASEKSLILPTLSALAVGLVVNIWNLTTQTLNIFPPSGSTIQGGASDTIAPNNRKTYIARNSTTYWIR